jgi:subtilisin family serine protease
VTNLDAFEVRVRYPVLLSLLFAASTVAADTSTKIAPEVATALDHAAQVEVLVTLAPADVETVASKKSGDDRIVAAVAHLRQHAAHTQKPLRAWLDARGVDYQAFWVANFIAVRGDAGLVAQLAALDDVRRIELNAKLRMEGPVATMRRDQKAIAAVEPGVAQVNAPAAWALGHRGQGVLIGGQDTGYDWDHPALLPSYAGWNGSSATHDYHWHDAIHASAGACGSNSPEPCDDSGHGTHTMGTIVGDDGAGSQIGVAPAARWMACRNMDNGVGTPTTYSECFQYFLAPTDRAGNNPDPTRAPHIINNSWGCPPSEGCDLPDILKSVVENVRNAGILVVVSAGNRGPACSTVLAPPAIYAAGFSVGAVNGTSMAPFSSRGPVLVDGSNRIKPDIVAPGVSTRSSIPGGGYASASGTSMAAPHVAGVAALLMSADPSLKRNPARVEALLRSSAVADIVTNESCDGQPPTRIPNSIFGHGRVDTLSALNLLGALNQAQDEPRLSRYALPAPIPAFPSCPSGFFVATVDDGPGAGLAPGAFGMELLLDDPGTRVLAGGLNFGGLVDAGQVGFAGFNFANAANENQRLDMSLRGSPASDAAAALPVRVVIRRSTSATTSDVVFDEVRSLRMAEASVASITVAPGFYVATVAVEGASPDQVGGAAEGQFYFELTTRFVDRPGGGFQGGAVVGGYHATHPFAGVSGFAGFCLATPHSTSVRVLSQPSYGATGASDLRLQINDAQSRPVAKVPAG